MTSALRVAAVRFRRAVRVRALGVCIVGAAFLYSLIAAADPVPPSRKTAWSQTGVPGGIPHRTTVCATFQPGATASQINAAIASCSDGVVLLAAGTYSLSGPVRLTRSNVTLRVAGAARTIILGAGALTMKDSSVSTLGTAITGGATKDSTTFTVASTTKPRRREDD